MFTRAKLPIFSLALVPVLASASFADGFGISFTKSGKHGSLSLGYSTGPVFAGSCEPRVVPPAWPGVWVPGHYETVYRQVWVDDGYERVWVEPVYRWRSYGCGRPVRVRAGGGYYERVYRSGRFEARPVRTWVPGGWRS